MATILIAEDDPEIAGLIRMTLEIAGYHALVCYDGNAAMEQIERGGFEMALLDVMLPGASGYDLLEALKKRSVPALFVTAKVSVPDRVHGLRLGAEDYITKPFEPIELLARVETALRRIAVEDAIAVGEEVTILPQSREVLLRGEKVALAKLEYELLLFLARHRNIAYSREQLLDAIWGYDYFGGTRTVDMHVQKLRSKLGLEDRIKTVHKLGYRLEG